MISQANLMRKSLMKTGYLNAYRVNDEIMLEVADNGSGISATELPYIFDRYYQVETSAKNDYSGIGLELSICKSIIDSPNGRMKVMSIERAELL